MRTGIILSLRLRSKRNKKQNAASHWPSNIDSAPSSELQQSPKTLLTSSVAFHPTRVVIFAKTFQSLHVSFFFFKLVAAQLQLVTAECFFLTWLSYRLKLFNSLPHLHKKYVTTGQNSTF